MTAKRKNFCYRKSQLKTWKRHNTDEPLKDIMCDQEIK
jgi:hypothetical protein